jgi:FKBP-type peptidyl-prolyl cis-trans isomerase
MVCSALLLLPLLLSNGAAFTSVQQSMSMQRYRSTSTTHLFSTQASPLEVVDSEAQDDPFNSYEIADTQKTIAFKDTKVGSGSTAEKGNLVQVKYSAKLMGSKYTANIKEFEVPNQVFQTGEQRCLPGLEEGMMGMKVGGSRLIRVPPNKGYGDKWYRGVVPPNSHLEFDCTLVNVAQNGGEEFMMKLEQFGIERAVGAGLCFAYLALSPIIEKKMAGM